MQGVGEMRRVQTDFWQHRVIHSLFHHDAAIGGSMMEKTAQIISSILGLFCYPRAAALARQDPEAVRERKWHAK
jgi:hypothetical protein